MNKPLDAEFWFDIADELRPVSDIPDEIAKTVLAFLNEASVDEIAYAVPLLDGWTEEPIHAKRIVEARGERFTSLKQLWETPGLSPARFTEVIRSIASTDPAEPVQLASSTKQPSTPVFSSSETELKFEYEILMPGPLKGLKGRFPAEPPAVEGFGSRN